MGQSLLWTEDGPPVAGCGLCCGQLTLRGEINPGAPLSEPERLIAEALMRKGFHLHLNAHIDGDKPDIVVPHLGRTRRSARAVSDG